MDVVGDDFRVVADGFSEDDSGGIGFMGSRRCFGEGVVGVRDGKVHVGFISELWGWAVCDFVVTAEVDDGLEF